jgi:uncharacterized cupin superfamily protein
VTRGPRAATANVLRVSLKKVNVLSVELDEALDEAGFRHAATTVGARLGAQRIGASVYEAEAGVPIWPYHYHHGIEEWLYVIAGAPVLREPAGERVLTAGDLVCFPSGHLGAHTVNGAGRFVIFATGQHVEPYLSVYPDSDKVSGPGGILLRSSAVGYWHGEGTGGPSESVEIVREPESSPPQPAVNVQALRAEAADPHAPTGSRYRAAKLGPLLGAGRLDGTVVDVDPGEGSEPYHYVFGREEWLLVVGGTPTLRHPEGEDQLEAGDLVCFPEGPAGAHQLLNRGESVVRALFLSTTGLPANFCYPDTGHWLIRNGLGQDEWGALEPLAQDRHERAGGPLPASH